MASRLSRRQALAAAGGLPFAAGIAPGTPPADGTLKQSVCRWCYARMPLDQLCQEARRIGYRSVELLNPSDVATVKRHGLGCAVLNGGPSVAIGNCLNRPENHPALERDLRAAIDFCAAEGVPNVICFSGNRGGMPDDVGLKNCAAGLKRVVGHAESRGVTIILELLNSKVDHKDYMADRTEWGVGLVNAVGSPRCKLLYDIYHMQVMEGDVIATIRRHHAAIAHYHTAGVPGRNEIDDGQELNYPAVMRAIRATGYQGYVGQEFIPKREPVASLAEGFHVCNV
jgi:hydroxypyruvate isomerase